MKKALAFLLLVMLGMRLGAQVVGPPDPYGPSMSFWPDFFPLGNSLPDSGVRSEVDYTREVHIGPNNTVYTNVLFVTLSFTTPPESAWILEKEADDTFSKVVEITNLLDGSIFEQSCTLTVDQVHSLISGNWYEEVDIGTNSYLGNLIPNSWLGPQTILGVSSPAYAAGYGWGVYYVIATNNNLARVVLDGSRTIDQFYLPMQTVLEIWTSPWEVPQFVSTNNVDNGEILITNVLNPGEYLVGLHAKDSIAEGWPAYIYLEVNTPAQVVNSLMANITESGLPRSEKQILNGVLSNAAALFDQGKVRQGCSQLRLYLVLIKVFHLESRWPAVFSQPAQRILDAFGFRGQ